MWKSETHLETAGRQKLKPWAVPGCLTVSSDSPTEAFRSPPSRGGEPPQVEEVLYPFPDTAFHKQALLQEDVISI